MYKSVILLFIFPTVFSASLSLESSSGVSKTEEEKKQLLNSDREITIEKKNVDPIEEFFNKAVLVKVDKFLPHDYQFGPPRGKLMAEEYRGSINGKFINKRLNVENELDENASEIITEKSVNVKSLLKDNLSDYSNELKGESMHTRETIVQKSPETGIVHEESFVNGIIKDKSIDKENTIKIYLVKEEINSENSLLDESTSNTKLDLDTSLKSDYKDETEKKLDGLKVLEDKLLIEEPIEKSHFRSSSDSILERLPFSLFSVRKRKPETREEDNEKLNLKKEIIKLKFDMPKIDYESLLKSSQFGGKSTSTDIDTANVIPSSSKSVVVPIPTKSSDVVAPIIKFIDVTISTSTSITPKLETITKTTSTEAISISTPSVATLKSTLQVTTKSTTEDTTTRSTTEKVTTRSTTEKVTTRSTTEKVTTRSTTEKVTTRSTTEKATTRSTTEKAATRSTTEEAASISTKEEATLRSTTEESTLRSTTEEASLRSTTEAATTRSTKMVTTSISTPSVATLKSTQQVTSRSTTEDATSRSTTEDTTTITTEKATTKSTTEEAASISTTEQTTLRSTTEEATSRSTKIVVTSISTSEEAPTKSTIRVTTRSTTEATLRSTTIEKSSRFTTIVATTNSTPIKVTSKSTTTESSKRSTTTRATTKFTTGVTTKSTTETIIRSTTKATTTSTNEEILRSAPKETTSKSKIVATSIYPRSGVCGEHCGLDGTFSIKSGLDWSHQLDNSSALDLFKNVSREIVVDLIRIFKQSSIGSSFRSVHINSIYPVSDLIIVDIYLRLHGINLVATAEDVKAVFSEGLVNSTMGRFKIEESRTEFLISKDRAPRRKVNKMEILDIILPDWAWMGIGVLTVSVSFIGILGIVFACNRRNNFRNAPVVSPYVLAHIRKKMKLDGICDDSFTEDIIQDIRSSVSGCRNLHQASVRRGDIIQDIRSSNLHRTSVRDKTVNRSRTRSEGSGIFNRDTLRPRAATESSGPRDSYRPRAATESSDSYRRRAAMESSGLRDSYRPRSSTTESSKPRDSYRTTGYQRGTSRDLQINHKNVLINRSNQQISSKSTNAKSLYRRHEPNSRKQSVSQIPSVSSYNSPRTSLSSYDCRRPSVSSYESRRLSVSSCDSRQHLVSSSDEEVISSNIFTNGSHRRGRNDQNKCQLQRQVMSSGDEETMYDSVLTGETYRNEKKVAKVKRFAYTKDSWSGGVYAVPARKRRTPLPGFEIPRWEVDLPITPVAKSTASSSASASSLESPTDVVKMLSYRKI